jgi:hypothetical protein
MLPVLWARDMESSPISLKLLSLTNCACGIVADDLEEVWLSFRLSEVWPISVELEGDFCPPWAAAAA